MKLNNLRFEELESYIIEQKIPKYRAGQLFGWFAQGVTDIAGMSNIPKGLQYLETVGLEIVRKLVSRIDGTVKYLFGTQDGHYIEAVFMRYKHGNTVCISTQVGCRMGCGFCASGALGLSRNLSAGEILAQVALIKKDMGESVSNIVLMGIGEPLDNFENVMIFLENVNHPKGMNIGYRHISLSTCGLVDRIVELAERRLPITLSVSLHAPNDEIRGEVMPINRKYDIARLIQACRHYVNETHRRISFEYILIDGLNDGLELANELAGLVRGMLCHVNLIPANHAHGGYRASGRARAFQQELVRLGINATIRRELGSDINAACGQLRLDQS